MKNAINKKRLYYILAIITVVVVFLVGGVLAYLTATDSKINKFVMGDVKIKIHEDNFVPTVDTDNDGEPDAVVTGKGRVTPKNPQIENIGDNSAYVYVKVVIPNRDYCVGGTEIQKGDIFEYTVNDEHWKELVEARSTDGGNNIYVYYYDEILDAPSGNEQVITTPLFDSMKLKDEVRNVSEEELSVGLYAYAIQEWGLPDGVYVENTEWAESFKSAAVSKPYMYNVIVHTSVEDCSLGFESIDMDEGDIEQISITKPVGAVEDIEAVTYSSSKEHVATVDAAGVITAVGRGKTTITIQGNISRKTRTIEVNVNGEVTLDECDVSVANYAMNEGETQPVIITNLVDESLDIEELSYSSSNTDVATVDENGNITAGIGGKATIKVTGAKTGLEKTILVDVLANLGNLSSSNLGAYVDLDTNILSLNALTFADNTKPVTDWRVFLKEENGTWLMLSSYLPQSKLPSGTGLNLSTAPYCINSSSSRAALIDGLNSGNWKNLVSENATLYNNSDVIVKGAATLQEWVNSWNSNDGYIEISVSGNDASGWDIANADRYKRFWLAGNVGSEDTLYFTGLLGWDVCYWLSSPVNYNNDNMEVIGESGKLITGAEYYLSGLVLRPVVFIPNN